MAAGAAAPLNPVVLGAVLRPHGLRGELAIRLFNPESALLSAGGHVWVVPRSGQGRWMEVVEVGKKLLKLKGLMGRTEADALRGAELVLDRAALPPPQTGEVYLHDLIGCRVSDATGKEIGTFRGLQTCGSREYFVIDGAREVLLPADAPVVEVADLEARTLRLAVEVDSDDDVAARNAELKEAQNSEH